MFYRISAYGLKRLVTVRFGICPSLRLEECPRFVQVLPFCNRDTMGRRRSFHARNLAPARPRLRPPASSCENYEINATYLLTEIATAKVVVTGQTFSRVSYDIPGQAQRFARLRGLRDAETARPR